jgi:hypothetical protein
MGQRPSRHARAGHAIRRRAYGEDWRSTYERQLAGDEWQHWNDQLRTDPDLAAHVTMVRSRGLCLRGGAIAQVFPAVPAEHYTESILDDFRWARERMGHNPVYFVLNACRIYAYLAEGRVLSKDEGGVWASNMLPEAFRELVVQTLEMYRGLRDEEQIDEQALQVFADYASERLH